MKANSLIIGSFFIVMCLSVFPFPTWALWLRPEFTLIVLIYWALTIPERCGLFMAMLVGLFQDSLTASILGKHMLSYTIVIALILFTYQKLRMLGVWQQAFFIFLLLAMAQLIELWISKIVGNVPIHPVFLLSPLAGALLWPWFMVFLREMTRKMGVTNHV